MPFTHALRFTVASVLVAAALCGCQGDDNVLPLPPDAGSDAHADATTAHDGAAEGSTKDSQSGETSSEPDSSDANAVPTDSSPDALPSEASASDASTDALNEGASAVSPTDASVDSALE